MDYTVTESQRNSIEQIKSAENKRELAAKHWLII